MRQRSRLAGSLFVAVFALAAAGCGDDSATSAFEVQGYVRDDASHHGIGGAHVTFTSDTLYTSSASTDGDGHYEMIVQTDVLTGRVRAEASGYMPAEASVFFDQMSRRVDLELRKVGSTSDAGR